MPISNDSDSGQNYGRKARKILRSPAAVMILMALFSTSYLYKSSQQVRHIQRRSNGAMDDITVALLNNSKNEELQPTNNRSLTVKQIISPSSLIQQSNKNASVPVESKIAASSVTLPPHSPNAMIPHDDTMSQPNATIATTETATTTTSKRPHVPLRKNLLHKPITRSSKKQWKNGFAACLLFKDDNHHLIEWLAYHYVRMPLRRIIMCVDDSNNNNEEDNNQQQLKTTPSYILERYTSRGLMEIDIWNKDDIYTPDHHEQWIVGKHTNNGTEMTESDKVYRYINFQNICIKKCFRQLKSEVMENNENASDVVIMDDDNNNNSTTNSNTSAITPPKWTWVSAHDVDEYIIVNNEVDQDLRIPQQNTTTTTTIGELLDRANELNISEMLSSPCVAYRRSMYGAKEDDDEKKMIPNGFNGTDFMTYRFVWRATPSGKKNGVGKALVDLSRIEWTDLESLSTTHRPVKAACPRANAFVSFSRSPLIANHYVGTLEQYLFREDPRRNTQQTRTVAAYELTMQQSSRIRDDSIHGWLDDFVEDVGSEALARTLLQGAGYIDHDSHWKLV